MRLEVLFLHNRHSAMLFDLSMESLVLRAAIMLWFIQIGCFDFLTLRFFLGTFLFNTELKVVVK